MESELAANRALGWVVKDNAPVVASEVVPHGSLPGADTATPPPSPGPQYDPVDGWDEDGVGLTGPSARSDSPPVLATDNVGGPPSVASPEGQGPAHAPRPPRDLASTVTALWRAQALKAKAASGVAQVKTLSQGVRPVKSALFPTCRPWQLVAVDTQAS
eukprot:7066256-Prorocentrum_lima.AAC.1